MSKNLDQVLEFLENYKKKTNCRGVVIGISGGKDSTVVAMLAKKVWGDKVLGVLMPNGEQKDIKDSLQVVNTLGISYKIVNIGEAYNALLSAISASDNSLEITNKAKTNIPPRLRMTTLYAIGQSLGYRVIGTGNASEAFLGWFTKFGDGAYDFNPIADLTCTEVIELGLELAEEFALDSRLIAKAPADGLTGHSDEDNFGFTYKALDSYIKFHVHGDGELLATPEECEAIRLMHVLSEHKRRLPVTINNFNPGDK